jgi:hypothetical protein
VKGRAQVMLRLVWSHQKGRSRTLCMYEMIDFEHEGCTTMLAGWALWYPCSNLPPAITHIHQPR